MQLQCTGSTQRWCTRGFSTEILTLDSCSAAPRSRGHSVAATSSMPAAAAAGGDAPAGCTALCSGGCLPGVPGAADLLAQRKAARWSTKSPASACRHNLQSSHLPGSPGTCSAVQHACVSMPVHGAFGAVGDDPNNPRDALQGAVWPLGAGPLRGVCWDVALVQRHAAGAAAEERPLLAARCGSGRSDTRHQDTQPHSCRGSAQHAVGSSVSAGRARHAVQWVIAIHSLLGLCMRVTGFHGMQVSRAQGEHLRRAGSSGPACR